MTFYFLLRQCHVGGSALRGNLHSDATIVPSHGVELFVFT